MCNVGGLTEAMKVAGWCEAHYIDLMPHNPLGPICTAATVHLAAAVPNFAWLEIRTRRPRPALADDRDPVPGPAAPGRPAPVVTDAPGLGVEVDEAAVIAASTTNHWNPFPQFRRRDGSVQNW